MVFSILPINTRNTQKRKKPGAHHVWQLSQKILQTRPVGWKNGHMLADVNTIQHESDHISCQIWYMIKYSGWKKECLEFPRSNMARGHWNGVIPLDWVRFCLSVKWVYSKKRQVDHNMLASTRVIQWIVDYKRKPHSCHPSLVHWPSHHVTSMCQIDVNVACKMNLSGNLLQFLNLSFNGQVV